MATAARDFDWKDTLAAVAPGLAASLGGPLAGIAAQVAVSALGYDPDERNPQDVLAELVNANDPETMLKLKQAEIEWKKFKREADIRERAVVVDDRKDARLMARMAGMAPQVILSGIYTIGYFWLLGAMVSGDVVVPEEQQKVFGPLIGVMTAAQVQIMNFWFGSSFGSRMKDAAAQVAKG